MTGTRTFNAQLEIANFKKDNKLLFNAIALLLNEPAYDSNTDHIKYTIML